MTDQDAVDERIERALDVAYPGRSVAAVAPGGISWNDQNETARVDFADGERVYLKVAVDGDGTRIVRERAVVDYVAAHCDVAVPTVLASDAGSDPPYLVTAPMQGWNLVETWSDRTVDEREAIVREIGTALAAIHAERFERHGHVVGGGRDGLDLDTGPWTDVLLDTVDSIRERASTDRFEHHFPAVRSALEANRERLAGAPVALVYGDPAHPNLFSTPTGIGFVDWEIAHVGDPARELNRARHQLHLAGTDRLVSALHEGYRRRAGSLPEGLDERGPVYDVLWYLGTSAVFDKVLEMVDDPEEAVESHEAEMTDLLDRIR